MKATLTIGDVARQSGLPAKTIRFYETAGVIPAPARTAAGYRLYTSNDVRRLRLARRARLLGLSLPEVAALVTRAFTSDCGAYADQVLAVVDRQRGVLDRRIAELQALRTELDVLEADVRDAKAGITVGRIVATCGRCPLIDEETGEPAACRCDDPLVPSPAPIGLATERSEPTVTRSDIASDEILDILACDIGARPAEAPTPLDLLPFVRGLQREPDQLRIHFDPAAASAVAAFADAELHCCTGIGWAVEDGELTTLRVTATRTQLDVLEQAWPWTAGA